MTSTHRVMMISTHGYVSAEPELGRPDTGGQVVYVLELSKSLAQAGHPVDIFTRRFDDQPEIEEVAEGVRIVRIPCGAEGFIPKETLCESIPEWIDRAHQWIRSRDLHYTWIDSHYWDAGLAGQGLADRLGCPHLHTPHSLGAWKRDNMDGDPEQLEQKYNFRRRVRDEHRLYHRCDGVIATTPQQAEILQGDEYAVAESQLHVVPPGCDPTRFQPVSAIERERAKRATGMEGRWVLALGRLAANKGYDLLIEAMVPVFQRHEDVRLMLAVGAVHENEGERRLRSQLRAKVEELGIAGRVEFRDHVPDDELVTYYRAADVFALSSRYEPFGMTAIEAMACGTPTVVTTEGGLWKQVTWGVEAVCADPFDPEAFGHAIHSVLRYRRLARQLSENGSDRARSDFAWKGIARQILEVGRQLPLAATPPPTTAAEECLETAS